MDQPEDDRNIIADRVRDFYDRYPYPPPVKGLNGYRQKWQDEGRRRTDYHLFWPWKPYREDLDILIAGCGTSQAARHALRWPGAQVTGVDVSATSIQETENLKDHYGLTNLKLYQLPVERIHELHQEFDKIICTGVLHHLADPDLGLRALRNVLKPNGAVHLMVYAPYGRAGIYMIQEYCRCLGIGPSDKEITELVDTLMVLPLDHPLAHLLGESPDFRRKAAVADALLNPQDRAYTVSQLFAYLERAGLSFGRWLRQAPYLPCCGDLAKTPHAGRLAQLSDQEQYAAVELFRGTMLRHSAIVYRDDCPQTVPSIQFVDDEWWNYIPHRLPNTIAVEDNLPAGAAGVLINQSHTYPDIYLPIDQKEKRIVEAINGRRTIDEISRRDAVKKPITIRALFQKLWWYDQVIFEQPG